MTYVDKEIQRAYQREWVASRRANYFKNKICVLCGSRDRLELDHIDPSSKLYNPSALWGMSDSNPKKITELAKCRILCYNCHKGKSKTEAAKGEATNKNKLTDSQVIEIRSRYVPGVISYRMLAEEYDVDHSLIYQIINNKKWKHLQGDLV